MEKNLNTYFNATTSIWADIDQTHKTRKKYLKQSEKQWGKTKEFKQKRLKQKKFN